MAQVGQVWPARGDSRWPLDVSACGRIVTRGQISGSAAVAPRGWPTLVVLARHRPGACVNAGSHRGRWVGVARVTRICISPGASHRRATAGFVN